MRTLRTAPVGLILLLLACPPETTGDDAGVDPPDAGDVDSGFDAGVVDAGHDAGTRPDAGPKDAGFEPFGVGEWCDMLALARCHRMERCLLLGEGGQAACQDRERMLCDQPALTLAVEEGRLVYSDVNAAACVNAHGAGSCFGDAGVLSADGGDGPCLSVFRGLVAVDAGCVLDAECEEGFCYETSSTCPSTPYRCVQWRIAPQSCNFGNQQCDPDDSVCTWFPDAGNYFCAVPKEPFSACGQDFSGECGPNMLCLSNQCLPQQAHIGEPCDIQFGWPFCETHAFCRQEPLPDGGTDLGPGVCAPRVGLGGVCPGQGSCLPGLRCSSNFATGTCIPLGGVGETCTNFQDCQEELFCRASTSRCTLLPGEGGDCGFNGGSSFQCAAGYRCEFQSDTSTYMCVGLGGVGEPCSWNGTCMSNACSPGTLPDGGSGFVCIESCSTRLDGGF